MCLNASSVHCETATFADDTAIFAIGQNPFLIQEDLQTHLNSISEYCNKWKIKINAAKSAFSKDLEICKSKVSLL
jgi:Reverse transcriptase (RNA-dependent DNA polymerase)